MVTDFMMTFVNMIVYFLDLFETIITYYDGWIYFIAGFTIYTIFRFLLFPILGGRAITLGSDNVKNSKAAKAKAAKAKAAKVSKAKASKDSKEGKE